MKRLLLLPLAAAMVAVVAWADGPSTSSADAYRVRQLQRNQGLIQALVRSGLKLAEEDDPLKRADYCTDLAQRFAREIQEAAEGKEGARAAELGKHFYDVMKLGVASNLKTVRLSTPAGSTRELEMHRLSDQTSKMLQPVEEQLQRSADADSEHMGQALLSLKQGRSEMVGSLHDAPAKTEK